VFTYCEKNNIPYPIVKEKGMAGHAWVDGFLHHNPMIASHKAQNLNPGRAQKLYHFIVNDYFAKHYITMEKLGVMNKPGYFYDVDEKGYSLCLHRHQLYTWVKEMLTGHITVMLHFLLRYRMYSCTKPTVYINYMVQLQYTKLQWPDEDLTQT
jgi:hypothetical protein